APGRIFPLMLTLLFLPPPLGTPEALRYTCICNGYPPPTCRAHRMRRRDCPGRADGGDAAAGPRHPATVAARGDRGPRAPGRDPPGDGPEGLHAPGFLMSTVQRD